MKREIFTILSNKEIAKDVYKVVLSGDISEIAAPGQFVNILIEGFYLRRPISICNWDNGDNLDYREPTLTLIYKVVGKGTKSLAEKQSGEKLDLLISLGNGFDVSKTTDKTLLCGGGVGVPPMVGLAKEMIKAGKKPQVVLGFNSKEDVFAVETFKYLGIEPIVTTVDGSYGEQGFVTDVIKDIDFDYVCTCGPEPMLKALGNLKGAFDGQFSFEARMACGFGGCMGCTCETKYGYKRICKEGPVLYRDEIIW